MSSFNDNKNTRRGKKTGLVKFKANNGKRHHVGKGEK